MINRVIIRRFKRFDDVTFDLRGRHIILAGPNNTGKTTVLQAVAAWGFALNRWRELNNYNQRRGWERAPITRQLFTPVSVRHFDLLWNARNYGGSIEIIVEAKTGNIGMEFIADSSEQIYVRPTYAANAWTLQNLKLDTVFVPAMTGLQTEETWYKPEKVDQFIGRNQPGQVLRNLLLIAYNRQDAWEHLKGAVGELFHIDLLPPDDSGADIISEYQHRSLPVKYDIASAGSGFQQVLMLLAYLHTRKGSVLLLDEPDAHLHIFLQEAVLQKLREAAAASGSQIIAATHSEVMIDRAELDELCVLLDKPVRLIDESQRDALRDALRVIDNVDLMNARICPGVLYLEDYTDLAILQAFAKVLSHPAQKLLSPKVYWKPMVSDRARGMPGCSAQDHYNALQLVRPGYPALELVDGDARPTVQESAITGSGYQRVRWRRYEIESYLLHPAALERFVEKKVGAGAASEQHRAALRKHFEETYPPAFAKDPLGDIPFLKNTKARTDLLPPALSAAGLPALPYTEYFEIAEGMLPQEIHPEVTEKLDAICRAFGQEVAPPTSAKADASDSSGGAGGTEASA